MAIFQIWDVAKWAEILGLPLTSVSFSWSSDSDTLAIGIGDSVVTEIPDNSINLINTKALLAPGDQLLSHMLEMHQVKLDIAGEEGESEEQSSLDRWMLNAVEPISRDRWMRLLPARN